MFSGSMRISQNLKQTIDCMTAYSQDRMDSDRRVLELLSQNFGNISAAATEIINLEAILNLPKGTEHFIADIHGESEAFRHILKNASGNIKRKIIAQKLEDELVSINEIMRQRSLDPYVARYAFSSEKIGRAHV